MRAGGLVGCRPWSEPAGCSAASPSLGTGAQGNDGRSYRPSKPVVPLWRGMLAARLAALTVARIAFVLFCSLTAGRPKDRQKLSRLLRPRRAGPRRRGDEWDELASSHGAP